MFATHLKKILAAKTFATPKTGKKVILHEEKVMKVEVAEVPPHLTAVDMRQVGSLSGLKNGEWMQICDYLLVFSQGQKDYAIFVELKKTLDEESKAKGKEQLRRSLPYLEYLRSVCEIQYDSKPANQRINVQYSLIGEKASQRIDKQHVKPRGRWPTECHEGILVSIIVRERINFRELWRK